MFFRSEVSNLLHPLSPVPLPHSPRFSKSEQVFFCQGGESCLLYSGDEVEVQYVIFPIPYPAPYDKTFPSPPPLFLPRSLFLTRVASYEFLTFFGGGDWRKSGKGGGVEG